MGPGTYYSAWRGVRGAFSLHPIRYYCPITITPYSAGECVFTITKEMYTETGHRLMDYDGKCAHLHGHSYRWQVTARAEVTLDKRGMVADFADLKRYMRAVIAPLDHAMLLRQDDPIGPVLSNMSATDGQPQRIIRLPFNPTAEELARYVGEGIHQLAATGQYGPSVRVLRVQVWETATSCAMWEYI